MGKPRGSGSTTRHEEGEGSRDDGALTLELADGVRSIAQADWDALVAPEDGPFVRWAWLASLEETGCVRPEVGWLARPLVVRQGERLLAALPLYLKGNSEGEFVFDHSWARFAQRLRVDYYPKLLAAVPFTPATGRRLLVHRDEDRAVLAPLLAKGLEAAVREMDVSSAHLLFANADDSAVLEKAGLAPRVSVQYHWENKGYSTYDDFLASFNSKRRHQLKRERRVVRESGVVIKTYRGREIDEEVLDVMERFYLATVEKFSPWTRQYLNRAFFEKVIERMPDAIEIVLARDGQRPIAGAFNVCGGNRLFGRYWGCEEERPFLHFDVCYYHSIEEAIDRKLDAFEPGAGGEHKLPRGFVPTRTRSFHVLKDPRLDTAIRDFVMDERAAIERELAGGDGDELPRGNTGEIGSIFVSGAGRSAPRVIGCQHERQAPRRDGNAPRPGVAGAGARRGVPGDRDVLGRASGLFDRCTARVGERRGGGLGDLDRAPVGALRTP
jgi:hypothetical protein